MREVSVAEFSKEFDEILNRVHDEHDSVIIIEEGKTVAVLIDMELFARLRTLLEQVDGAPN